MTPDRSAAVPRRNPVGLAILAALGLLFFASFLSLGTWQVHRLAWKRELIADVDARIHAAPVEAPARRAWPRFDAKEADYRRVRAAGVYLNDRETLVHALTELGAGYWVLTPLRTDAGGVILVNRGFVPLDLRDPATRAAGNIAGETTVTGLLRSTEPSAGFLRGNDPGSGRWYSRDVAAIAAARDLSAAAPYFVDADATPNRGGYPVGGLTVVAFPNNHLVYAITWYALAAMIAGAAVWMMSAARLRIFFSRLRDKDASSGDPL